MARFHVLANGSICLWLLSFAAMFDGAVAMQVRAESGTSPAKAKPAFTNRLSRETSPYLLLHAHNPVDWYPWGPEALEKAKRDDKLIFLSIGYSSCHWCHVMEQKVFSNVDIARYMNEHFVNIKIDREERPDLDDVYMTALSLYLQATGSSQTGGWPLSMFLTPTGKPLGGGTYFPPGEEEGRLGFPTLMKRVLQSWEEKRPELETNAELLTKAVQASSRPRVALEPVKLSPAMVTSIYDRLKAGFDPDFGGFGFNPDNADRPKFPLPTKLALLQYQAGRTGDEQGAAMLYATLDHMAAGGIHDQLGGGFHRYSTDRFWRVPHFEKMLYDNAQLIDVYAEAFRKTRNARYRDVVVGIVEFVFRDLTDPQGAFYAALDADTDGVEGKYYVWSTRDLKAVLSAEELQLARQVYGLEEPPNFELGHVLLMPQTLAEIAQEWNVAPSQIERRVLEIKKKLIAARDRRELPALDDKILTSWNGLMIRALANAGAILDKPEYIQAADKAATFILTQMRDDKGNLRHTYRNQQATLNAYLDDYAFLCEGLLALQQATGDEKWSNAARRLTDAQLDLFWDAQQKGCYFTSHDHEEILAKTKSAYDSVLPSGNSVTVRNLLRLAAISKQPVYRERAKETLELFTPAFQEFAGGSTNMALALAEYLQPPEQSSAPAATPAVRAPVRDSEIETTSGERPAAKRPKTPELVSGDVYLSVDRLPAGRTCQVLVHLKIADKWHINANPAQPDYMVPTKVTLKSKRGTKLAQVRYPVGEKLEQPGAETPLSIYSHHADILGVIEVPVSAAGGNEELTVEIKYQACNDKQCLPIKTLTLSLPVPVAKQGEPVKAINAKLFPPARSKTPAR